MNYISISILIFYLLLIFENSITIWYPPDWDLQGDHSLLQADNLRGIDPYSRKVYYLDDPVHLLVSCAKLWQRTKIMNVRIKFLAPLPRNGMITISHTTRPDVSQQQAKILMKIWVLKI